ncbi:MAG TPA: type II secretion system protein GspL [Paraburkholderia sp.]|jgi:general secretion pathway protein L
MSSLIVLLPSADAQAASADGFDAMPMPFALLDRSGETTRAGHASLAELPRAMTTVLVVAARDTLLLKINLPPVTGPRLRRVLPNVVEEHLIQDAQGSHIAIGPDADPQGERCAAIIDRDWFAGVIERFAAAGHRKLRAVPLVHCIPLLDAPQAADQAAKEVQREEAKVEVGESDALFQSEADAPEDPNHAAANDAEANTDLAASALIARYGIRRRLNIEANSLSEIEAIEKAIDDPASAETKAIKDSEEHIEIAVRQGMLGFGMTIRAAQLDATIAELAKRQPLVVYSLALEASSNSTSTAFPLAALTLPWPSLARDALACRFDLCQFEFANGGRSRAGVGGLKPWRIAIGVVAAALIVSLVAINVQWIQLRHRRDALNAQMTELVKSAFPDATVILDPHAQMAAGLARLRSAAGELRPDDFAVLASGLSRALGSIPSSAIAGLDYNSNALDVTFKPGTTVDSDGLTRRLAAQGLSAQEDNGKWSIRSAQRSSR